MFYDLRVAYHEAGHAVMGRHFNVPIQYIYKWPKGHEASAGVVFDDSLREIPFSKKGLILLAGNVAQSIHIGSLEEDYGSLNDFKPFIDRHTPEEIAKLWWQAHSILSNEWEMVERLAITLMESKRRHVMGKRIEKILKAT